MSRLSFSRYHSRETPRAATTRLLLYLTNSTFFDLDWFPYKTNLHLWLKTTLYYTSMYPLPLSRNAKGSDHPLLYLTNSLTGVASTPNQTLHLYVHFLHRFLFKVKEKASWIGFHTKANLLLCQINLHFPNKFVSSKQISVCQRCLFVCEGEVCLNCVLS